MAIVALISVLCSPAYAQTAQRSAAASPQPLARAKSWGYQLRSIDPQAIAASSYDVVVIDFAQQGHPFTAAEVAAMRTRPDGGRRTILAYLSIGEAERYRFYWQPSWYLTPPAWVGPENTEWRGNYLVRFWDAGWQKVIFGGADSYLDQIMAAGFDGAYLDRVDAYSEWEKVQADAQQKMAAFVTAISAYAKQRNAKFQIAVQNAEELLEDADYLRVIDAVAKEDLLHGIDHSDAPNPADDVQHSVELLQRARKAGKAVFVVEYLCRHEDIAKAQRRISQELGFVPYMAPRTLHSLGLSDEDHCLPIGQLGRRIALLIGNSNYRHAPVVAAAATGAGVMAATLRKAGFTEVRERIDLTRDALNHEIQRFAETARTADWAILYYAGLGLHFNGANFMLPVNARIEQSADIVREAIAIEEALRAVAPAAVVRLVLLDACRPNPILEAMRKRGMAQATGAGMTARPSPHPVIVGYASQCDEPASVKDGEPDAYTAALVRHIPTLDLELPWLLERVRDSVLRSTKGGQSPAHFGQLPDGAKFMPGPDAGKPAAAPVQRLRAP